MDNDSLLIPESESTPATREEDRDDDQVNDENCLHVEETQKNFLRIGITQLVLGIVSIIASIIVGTSSWSNIDRNVPGAWCGIFVLISGSLAIALKCHLNYGVVVIANVVASILASLFGLALVILTAASTMTDYYISLRVGNGISCIVSVAWTTLCVYHVIIVTRIFVQNKAVSHPACCLGTYPPSYPGMPMAYIPGSRLPNGIQTVSMAVPANGMMPCSHALCKQ